ncbi:hypothetical protein LTR36_000505 [Oleoguttula mirabilis]|uniref:F-box domain-containing protein n=1 Tax=Oleoguttula mirabilis TaxID=1507867 RepID=A0AAV9JQ30_9PEZI|nr:hypothetical protein LTR36_000505 [Oleoguttula mirabilis]
MDQVPDALTDIAIDGQASTEASASTDGTAPINASAAARTLNTTELLEHIFLTSSLDIHDLVQAQRVNVQWRNTISGSTKLKPTLFLAAQPCESYLYWMKDRHA